MCRTLLNICCSLGFASLIGSIAQGADPIDFNKQIRPLLAEKCFTCHGPDDESREADLRFDMRDSAVDYGAIVPGDADASDLVRVVFSDDPDERMPPPESNDSLSEPQQRLLRDWIIQGAVYQKHWSFVAPSRSGLPEVKLVDWPRNGIDYFVLARQEENGLSPAPQSARAPLVRRLYLDLIGLPPTPAEADAFVADDDPEAYEKLVDQLLASPHYGERWARHWLDMARYADTNGYEKDRPRSIWPYRDWVIKALNDDMPFPQFTVEQLAGDMLPEATVNQQIATGFHRNTMLNEEGGIDPLEYRYYAMVDRVATTGIVWMGLSIGCAQCHTHKFDPISHDDYYRFMALLNNADEPDLIVADTAVAKARDEIEQQIAARIESLESHFPPDDGEGTVETRRIRNAERAFQEWLKRKQHEVVDWQVIIPTEMESNLPRLEVLEDGSLFSTGDITKRDLFTLKFPLEPQLTLQDQKSGSRSAEGVAAPITAIRLEVLPDDRLPARGPGRAFYEGRKGDFFLSEVTARVDDSPLGFEDASHSFGQISIGSGDAKATHVLDGDGSTGWSTSGGEGKRHQLVLNLEQSISPQGELEIELLFERHFAASLGRFRFAVTTSLKHAEATTLPLQIETLIADGEESWTNEQRENVKRYFLLETPELEKIHQQIDKLRATLPQWPTTMVLRERQADNPRRTYLHHRGEYLQTRNEMEPGLPELFEPAGSDVALPKDRLGLARWLASSRNPLAARVAVNRAWAEFFGAGIVRSVGDFGTQGDPPTHPRLLDWMAVEWMDKGWSMKKLHRLIVTSSTYRQSSIVTAESLDRDPQNRWLSRGPRFRVNAEIVRDVLLTGSGLLSLQMYGPSVYPPQPESVTALAYGNTPWAPSEGENRYRRSLYTFSKRTAPFAAYSVFDGPTGESCVVKRDRSNTPLQALTLMNDDMYLELAVMLAKDFIAYDEQESDAESKRRRVVEMFRRLMTRYPVEKEVNLLVAYHGEQERRLSAGELDARAILMHGTPENEMIDESTANRWAAWTMVARSLMNLDEIITKQ